MNKISRRSALGAGIAGVSAVSGLSQFSATALAAAQTLPLRAVVTMDRVNYEYRETDGKQLEDFVSTIGGFTQRCIRSEVSGCPLRVFFRPDRNSDRVEVVFEHGHLFNAVPVNLGAYSVAISRGSEVLATIDVPAHYWFSRWRWQSSPRPVVGDVAALIAQNLLPPYDRDGSLASAATAATIAAPVRSLTTTIAGDTAARLAATTILDLRETISRVKFEPYTIMGLAGLMAYMPSTGERQDIGIVTEAQAEYICTARQTAHDVMRAQAEAAGTIPWHMRDERTGAPIDLKKYPQATWYPQASNGNPYVKTAKTPVVVDSAHQPALAYVPYLLTGDPYHLEDLQFQATWNLGSLVSAYRMSIPQARTFAWNLRTLAQCARITPANVPSWLLPRHYWAAFLSDYRHFFESQYMNSDQPERARFRATRNIIHSIHEGPTAPAQTWIDPWQDDFVATVLGWVISMGFVEWQMAFHWKMGSTIARTSLTSGWVRAHATPYRLILRANATAPFADNWAEAWALTESIGNLTYVDKNTWVPKDMTYLTYTRGALVYIAKLRAANVTENLDWATDQLNKRKWNTPYRWRLGSGLT